MLNVVLARECPDPSRLSSVFASPQTWIMNLARSMGSINGSAELTAKVMGLGSGTWVFLSPVFWQATHNDAMIVGVGEDTEGLYFGALERFVAQDGGRIVALRPDLWLLDASFLSEWHPLDLDQVLHQSLQPILEQMPLTWRRWWTEVQMLFETLRGGQAINGVWPWGAGAWHPQVTIYCNSADCLFKVVDAKPWNPKKWPKTGVILLDAGECLELNLLSSKTLGLWWSNGYVIQKPLSFWQRLKSWVTYAN